MKIADKQKDNRNGGDTHHYLRRLVLRLRDRRIRKTKEAIAYWSAKAEISCRFINGGEHTGWDREKLVTAYANQKRYEARLAHYSQSATPKT